MMQTKTCSDCGETMQKTTDTKTATDRGGEPRAVSEMTYYRCANGHMDVV